MERCEEKTFVFLRWQSEMSLGEPERAAAVRVRVRAKNGSVAQCVIEAQAVPRLSSRVAGTSAVSFIYCDGRKPYLWSKVRPSVLGKLVGKSWQLCDQSVFIK